MVKKPDSIEKILDAALKLADQYSWEAVRLHDVATATRMTLDEVRHHVREKEQLSDAWFDRADAAMLQDAATPEFLQLTSHERLHRVIMTWLGALAAHRRVTRQIILSKCELGHIHIQVPGVLRISRTVQWMREAAHRDATHVHRALEETILTSIYLTTFLHWMVDDSANSARTRTLLHWLLHRAEQLANHLPWFLPDLRSRLTTSPEEHPPQPGRPSP